MPFTTTLPRTDKPVIAGHLYNGGTWTLDPEARCPACGWRGMLMLANNVEVCGHCRNITGNTDLTFDETEDIHSSASYIFGSIPNIKQYLHQPAS
jgi:hypothetical protein